MRAFDVLYEDQDGVYQWVTGVRADSKKDAGAKGRGELRKRLGDKERDFRVVRVERA